VVDEEGVDGEDESAVVPGDRQRRWRRRKEVWWRRRHLVTSGTD